MTLQAAIDGLIAENEELKKRLVVQGTQAAQHIKSENRIEELEQQVAELEETIHDIGYSD